MESQFFNIKVKYLTQLENQSIKKVTKQYVLKAISFTDAEAQIRTNLENDIPEFNIINCNPFNIQDVRIDETKQSFFKVKVAYQDIDEATGKVKKLIENYIIQGNEIKDVTISTNEMLNGSIMDYVIENIQLTKIDNVFYQVNK
tara:strand:- start:880 stop:1311 length:432 start_codon:yes stop_codon:yes gene_type:complete